jgi:hypothetical protein
MSEERKKKLQESLAAARAARVLKRQSVAA